MIKNMVVPFLEVRDCKDGGIYAIEIVNTEWVPKSTVLRRSRVSQAAKMAAMPLETWNSISMRPWHWNAKKG
jgi:hypothetical protein